MIVYRECTDTYVQNTHTHTHHNRIEVSCQVDRQKGMICTNETHAQERSLDRNRDKYNLKLNKTFV